MEKIKEHIEEFTTKHKYKLLAAAGGITTLIIGTIIYKRIKKRNKLNEEKRKRTEKEEQEIAELDKEDEELGNIDIYSDKELIKALKEINKNLFPVFYILQMKAEEIKKQVIQKQGSLPNMFEKVLFTILTTRDPYYQHESANVIQSVLSKNSLDIQKYSRSMRIRGKENPELMRINMEITESLRLSTSGMIPLPDIPIPAVLTPRKLIEIQLFSLKNTLLEYYQIAEGFLKRGEVIGNFNIEYLQALNLQKRPDEIRMAILREIGLDNYEEHHPSCLYMLAMQRFNSENSGGIREKQQLINHKMSVGLVELVTGVVTLDNLEEKRADIVRFVDGFWERNGGDMKDSVVIEEEDDDDSIIGAIDDDDA